MMKEVDMCGVPGNALNSARRVESSSKSDSPVELGARETYRSDKSPTAVIHRTSSMTWYEDSTAEWDQYATTLFPNVVDVHRKRVESEAEECVIVGLLEPFRRHAVDEMLASRIKDDRARRIRQGTKKMGLKAFHYGRAFRKDEMINCPVLKKLKLTAE